MDFGIRFYLGVNRGGVTKWMAAEQEPESLRTPVLATIADQKLLLEAATYRTGDAEHPRAEQG